MLDHKNTCGLQPARARGRRRGTGARAHMRFYHDFASADKLLGCVNISAMATP